MFSFGIVLWEILTGEEPYANMHYGAIIGAVLLNFSGVIILFVSILLMQKNLILHIATWIINNTILGLSLKF